MTLHQRLIKNGWTHVYRAPRWDYYTKKNWRASVPSTTYVEPIYTRIAA